MIEVGGGLSWIVLRYGFMEQPNICEGLRLARERLGYQGADPDDLTYYFRRDTIVPTHRPAGIAFWRKTLFSAMHLNANRTAAYFGVRPTQVIEIGLEVEI